MFGVGLVSWQMHFCGRNLAQFDCETGWEAGKCEVKASSHVTESESSGEKGEINNLKKP